MLTAIEYLGQRINFKDAGAELPVLLKGGGIRMVSWGRKLKQGGAGLPVGRWVPLEDLRKAVGVAHARVPVKVPASRYWMTNNTDERVFTVPPGHYLQAVLIDGTCDDFFGQVAYLVCVPAGEEAGGFCELVSRVV